MTTNRNRINILGLQLDFAAPDAVCEKIIHLASEQQSAYVCLANVHMTIEAWDDSEFRKMVNAADMVVPDGMPLARIMSRRSGQKQERVAGPDIFPRLLKMAKDKNLSVYFYGGTEELMNHTINKAQALFPELKVAGFRCPPFRQATDQELEVDLSEIRRLGPHLIFVLLGCPKQEKWMAQNSARIPACMIGIGGAVPIFSGEMKRAPSWMQEYSLEWFYRFKQEPMRLFRRYLYTNIKFLWLRLTHRL